MRHFQSFLCFYKCLWSPIHVAISLSKTNGNSQIEIKENNGMKWDGMTH